MEDGKLIQLETSPKKAPEIKSFFNYVVHDKYKNISLVLHVMSPRMFAEFKKPMLSWLQMNKISMSQYQEHINVLMEATAQEK
eukprot:7994714-Ditylum_brightwellii.AAC.1